MAPRLDRNRGIAGTETVNGIKIEGLSKRELTNRGHFFPEYLESLSKSIYQFLPSLKNEVFAHPIGLSLRLFPFLALGQIYS